MEPMQLDVDPKDLQRLYIQSQMYKPYMREEEALAVYEQCCQALQMPFRPDDFPGFLTNINQALDELNLSIRQEKHHSRDVSYCFLINEEADEISKLATTLSPQQIAVFRTLINKILEAPQGQLTSMDVLNTVPSTLMTKALFEKTVMHKLISEGWLEETSRGNYTLGVRTLVELKKYIEEGHPDLDRCLHCENVAIIRIDCATPDCDATYHRRCLEDRKNRAGARLPCGKCQQPIPLPAEIYPASTASGSDRSSRSGATKRARVDKTANGKDDDEEEEEAPLVDDDEDEDEVGAATIKAEPLTQRRRSTRTAAAAGSAARKGMVVDGEEDELETSTTQGMKTGGRRKAVVDDDEMDMD